MKDLPKTGFVRLNQIVSIPRKGTIGFLPICATTWWNGIKKGVYPKGIKLSERVTVWKAEDIHALLETLGAE